MALVLLHAGVADARMWDPVLARIDAAPLVLDLPGALSPAAILGRMDAACIRAAHLAAASFGGLCALAVAAAHPDRVTGLTLLAPALPDHGWGAEMEAYDARETAVLEAGDLAAHTDLEVATWAGGAAAEVQDLVRAMVDRIHEHEDRSDCPETIDLAAIRCPVTVAVGDRDLPDFPVIAERLRAETGAEVVPLPGAGHLLALERPDEVAALLQRTVT